MPSRVLARLGTHDVVAAVLEQPTGPALDTALRRALAALGPSG